LSNHFSWLEEIISNGYTQDMKYDQPSSDSVSCLHAAMIKMLCLSLGVVSNAQKGFATLVRKGMKNPQMCRHELRLTRGGGHVLFRSKKLHREKSV
jgi:hypothetical protein